MMIRNEAANEEHELMRAAANEPSFNSERIHELIHGVDECNGQSRLP